MRTRRTARPTSARRLASAACFLVPIVCAACNSKPSEPTVVADPASTAKARDSASIAGPPSTSAMPSSVPSSSVAPKIVRKRVPHVPPPAAKGGGYPGGDTSPLNPTDPVSHFPIRISADGTSCYVAPSGPPTPVDCPLEMDQANWDECRTGEVDRIEHVHVCICWVSSVPAEAPRIVHCPKSSAPEPISVP
jgi:hypothetical protein